jgi:hypothetical protein
MVKSLIKVIREAVTQRVIGNPFCSAIELTKIIGSHRQCEVRRVCR